MILVSPRQKGNPLLEAIKNVPWQFAEIMPDYQLGPGTVAFFLSLRYHLLHPAYILRRVVEMQRGYTLCVVIVLVDQDDHQQHLVKITRTLFVNKATVVLAWSNLEAARYLETLKAYQSKPADMLKQRTTGDHTAVLTDSLSAIRSVNKADVLTLSTSFGSMRRILLATEKELAQCPGLGEKKIQVLLRTFSDPFVGPSAQAHASRPAR